MNRLNRKQKNTKRWTSWNQVNKMLESHLQEKIKEVKELREFYLEGIEYVRNHTVWILDNYKKYGIRVEDIDKLELLERQSGDILYKFSPTESQQRNKTTDEEIEQKFMLLF